MNKLKISLLLSMVGASLFSSQALAGCSVVKDLINQSVHFGATVVQRDLTVNGGIANKTVPAGNIIIAEGCDDIIRQRVAVNVASYPMMSGGIFATGVQGVGMRIRINDVDLTTATSFTEYSATTGANLTRYNPKIEVTLFKTGTIVPGPMNLGNLLTVAKYSGTQFVDALSYNIASGVITQSSCELTGASAIPVNMGEVKGNDFNGKGSTLKPVEIKIPLQCDAGTRVNINLDATSSQGNGIIDLAKGGAEGVGIQLKVNDTPALFNRRIFIAEATEQGAFNIPLTAAYIQTDDIIRSGNVSAIANFTITYE